jgi:hypothetical protein
MKLEELVRDPLYQINLLLWMLTPSTGSGVDPMLHRAGFTVHQIEGDVRLPLKISAAARQKKIEVNNTAAPDLVLSGKKKAYLIIECKAAVFGPGDGSAQRQARTLLLQTPVVLTESLSFPPGAVATAHLLYLTAHDPKHDQLASLQSISEELRTAGFSTSPLGLLALRVNEATIMVDAAVPSSLQSGITNGSFVVQKLSQPDIDPRPLYRIAWMPGSEKEKDPYNEEQFAKRVLASAAMLIAQAKLYKSKAVRLPLEQVLDDVTSGFYKKWKKRAEAKLVRARAAEILRIQIGKVRQALLTADGQAVEVYVPDRAAQEEIVEKLRDWNTADYPHQVQHLLFNADNSRATSPAPPPATDPPLQK